MKLQMMREKAGLKQSELAMLSGVNLRSLQDYEQGHKPIQSAKGETLLRLSSVLGYSVEDIIRSGSTECDAFMNRQDYLTNRLMAYEKCVHERKSNEVHFPIIIPDEKIDMSRIYPTQQACIKKIISELRSDSRVECLRLFGSSISMACHRDSDIDLAVGLSAPTNNAKNEISEKIQLACNWNADILWMDRLSPTDRVYGDIMKGLVLI